MKTPKSPDYEAAAREQGQANIETARFNATANRPNINTPYGSQVWSVDPTNPDRQVLNETLSESGQRQLDSTNRIQEAGLTALEAAMPGISEAISGQGWTLPGQAATSLINRPTGQLQYDVNMSGVPGVQYGMNESGVTGLGQTSHAARQRMEDAIYRRQASRLDPRFSQQQSDLETQLANQGITRGSPAFQREMENFNRMKDSAYQDAADSAIQGGADELGRQFAMDTQNRQQTWGEALQRLQNNNAGREQSFNELMSRAGLNNAALGQGFNISNMETQLHNAGRSQQYQELFNSRLMPINMMASMLGTAQVQNPQFQPFNNNITADAAPIFNAAAAQGQFNIGAANQRNALIGNLAGAGANLGSSYIRYSDRRLKSNIRRIGTTPGGYGWYEYDIAGGRAQGVMADEVPLSMRVLDKDGYWMVDYSKVV